MRQSIAALFGVILSHPSQSIALHNKVEPAFAFANTRNRKAISDSSTASFLPRHDTNHSPHQRDHVRRPTRPTELRMCQLLGMNCAALTDFSFSFRGFVRRGGDTDIHSHGWGLCTYDGKGIRAFHDPDPAAKSLLAQFLHTHPLKTLNMISHIRYATRGEVNLENVHPFQREMWGISWCFAHNGDVSHFDRNTFAADRDVCGCPNETLSSTSKQCVKIPWIGNSIGAEDKGERPYNPIGATDSEAMFCAILNALRARFDTLPSLPVLHAAISSLCDEIVALDSQHDGNTILNFLMGCGSHTQFAYSWPGAREGSSVWNGLHYLVREPPFGSAHLSDCDVTIDFATVTKENDRIAVIATAPLTDDEEWVEIKRGQLILFDDGLPHMASADCYDAEDRNHGLVSDAMPHGPELEIDLDQRKRYKIVPPREKKTTNFRSLNSFDSPIG